MPYILYKMTNNDNKIYFTSIFENEEDAKDKKKLLTQDKTPEENLEETFYIKEIPFTTTEEYNRLEPTFRFIEDDNDFEEEYIYKKESIIRQRFKENENENEDINEDINEDENEYYKYEMYDILFIILVLILLIVLIVCFINHKFLGVS